MKADFSPPRVRLKRILRFSDFTFAFLASSLGSFALSATPATAVAGTRILLVGDSHSTGTFKDGFLETLGTQSDLESAVYASCGSSPSGWFRDAKGKTYRSACGTFRREFGKKAGSTAPASVPHLPDLITEAKPDVVVVAMGTNQYPGSVTAAEPSMRKMLKAVQSQNARCVWVGPPEVGFIPVAKQKEFYAMFERLAREEKCLLIDSRAHTDVAQTDSMKTHYPGAPGKKWGAAVGGRVLQFVREAGKTSARENHDTGRTGAKGVEAI